VELFALIFATPFLGGSSPPQKIGQKPPRPPPGGQKRSKSVQNRPREAKNSQNAPKHGQVPGFFEKCKIPHSFSDHFLAKNTFFSLFWAKTGGTPPGPPGQERPKKGYKPAQGPAGAPNFSRLLATPLLCCRISTSLDSEPRKKQKKTKKSEKNEKIVKKT
jgi:hypothetical protein